MESFAGSFKGSDLPPMKYLYHSTSVTESSEIIATLAFVRIMQDERLIVPEDETQVAKAYNIYKVADAIAEYSSFAAWINPDFTESSFTYLYCASMNYYKEHVRFFLDDFAMDLGEWKKEFSGSLFIS